MIPDLVIENFLWPVLPPGLHAATLSEVENTFATDPWRHELFNGIVEASIRLYVAGCQIVYLDGSYVSGKPVPRDFDACWDPTGVTLEMLDPIFLNFDDGRKAQKAVFKGELFPSSLICQDISQTFLDFFQIDRSTGRQKGLISIQLSIDPFLLRMADQ